MQKYSKYFQSISISKEQYVLSWNKLCFIAQMKNIAIAFLQCTPIGSQLQQERSNQNSSWGRKRPTDKARVRGEKEEQDNSFVSFAQTFHVLCSVPVLFSVFLFAFQLVHPRPLRPLPTVPFILLALSFRQARFYCFHSSFCNFLHVPFYFCVWQLLDNNNNIDCNFSLQWQRVECDGVRRGEGVGVLFLISLNGPTQKPKSTHTHTFKRQTDKHSHTPKAWLMNQQTTSCWLKWGSSAASSALNEGFWFLR